MTVQQSPQPKPQKTLVQLYKKLDDTSRNRVRKRLWLRYKDIFSEYDHPLKVDPELYIELLRRLEGKRRGRQQQQRSIRQLVENPYKKMTPEQTQLYNNIPLLRQIPVKPQVKQQVKQQQQSPRQPLSVTTLPDDINMKIRNYLTFKQDYNTRHITFKKPVEVGEREGPVYSAFKIEFPNTEVARGVMNQARRFEGEELDLSKLGIDVITVFLGNIEKFPRLRILNLSGNNLGVERVEETQAIARVLPNIPDLQSLNLSGNNIGVERTLAIVEVLPSLRHLQSLNLSGNNLGVEGSNAIARVLPNIPNLQSLNLAGNNLGVEGSNAIANALSNIPNIQSLNLAENDIGVEGLRAITEVLQHLPNLQSLDLSRSFIETDRIREIYAGIRAFVSALQHLHNLQHLNFSNNSVVFGDAINILIYLPELRTLNLSGNNINDDYFSAGEYYKFTFPHIPKLQFLDLSHNSMMGDTIEIVAKELLKHLPELRFLDLSNNNLASDASIALGEVLPYLHNLQSLNLSGNDTMAYSMNHIVSSLSHIKHLQYLDLSLIPMSDKDVIAIADVIPYLKSLQYLALDISRLHENTVKLITDAVKESPSIRYFNYTTTP